LLDGATVRENAMAGAGGMRTDSRARSIPALVLKVAGQPVQLSNLVVAPGPEKCHGVLGQDVLRSGAGYSVDFKAMRVEVLPATATLRTPSTP
jgi:hypothetical protein